MPEKKDPARDLFEWYDALVFALAAIVLIFLLFVRVITVSGHSMEPTLYGGGLVLLQSMQ